MFIPPANDPLLDYLTSALQKNGRRAKAARLVSRTLLHIHTSTRAPPMPIVREAILAASPAVKLGSHKYGTKSLQVPYALTEKQRIHAGVKAVLGASESRPGKSVDIRLARELIGVLQGESKAIVEKERLHKLAMVNRWVNLLVPSHFSLSCTL
ncbi:ribosomal protein S7 domain-containing protein [Pisolithus marmoratus]|nr:ribosomal protein S7 domain-containing protein [Pisolithus marmoratus]